MRVLGVDPGTRHLGWGVIERAGPGKVRHVAHGVIHASESAPLAERLVVLERGLTAVIDEHKPSAGSVETLFFARDAQAAAKLGHARGVVLLSLARAGVGVFEYAPSRVKRAVTGHGSASKEQVAQLMNAHLGLALCAGDAADALANAFAHLALSQFQEALVRSGVTLPPPYKPRRARAALPPRSKVAVRRGS